MLVENLNQDYVSAFWQDCLTHANSITVRVPGSTANLGPGFDTVALALGIYLRLTVTLLANDDKRIPLLTTLDSNNQHLHIDANSFVGNIVNKNMKLSQSESQRLRIFIQSDIPIARGLGSSAAVVTGLLWAATKLGKQNFDSAELLTQASIIEGHADNVAASLLGSLVVVVSSSAEKKVIAKKLEWPKHWEALVIVPSRPVPTAEARKLLPQNIPYEDAIHNLQHTALFLAAVQHHNGELLRQALKDRLHEPYRSQLVPELADLTHYLAGGPHLGCVLSGSGSSVLVLVETHNKQCVLDQIATWQSNQKTHSTLLQLKVDQEGLQPIIVES